MSAQLDPVSTPSPVAALTRPPKSRRTSPYRLSHPMRNSPSTAVSRYSPDRRIDALDAMDDSDDEGGRGPQLSHLAQMLLEDFPEASESAGETLYKQPPIPRSSIYATQKRSSWADTEDRPPDRSTMMRHYSREPSPEYTTAYEMATPAPARHAYQVLNGAYTAIGSTGSGSSATNSAESNKEGEPRDLAFSYNSIARPGPGGIHPSTTASAIRWKRAGRGLLGSLAGPPRRGPRRDSDQTTSEEHGVNDVYRNSPAEDQDEGSDPRSSTPPPLQSVGEEKQVVQQPMSTISRRPKRLSPQSLPEQMRRLAAYNSSSPDEPGSSGRSSPGADDAEKRAGSSLSVSRAAAIAAAAAALPAAPTKSGKENMPPPPAFRRVAAAQSYKRIMLPEDKPVEQISLSPSKAQDRKSLVAPPASEVDDKKPALSAKSNNTPLRPAPPPPPRMSMLEAATAPAGASVTSTAQLARRSRNVIHINGKSYQRLDAIGKGGSSRVYKVMAENKKMFALKKVSFTEQDGPLAIAGYKGEIDLLKRLSGVERVIQLFDYEVNDKKQTLSMLMECGESDLAKILTHRHASEDSRLDVSFVRYYWREMLLCVDAVHALNIIHSDLKPANFLLVQGRLKLIDFGIANAIEDDTVNVYRESQVGTLNYMSPEAIVDINATSGKPMASVGQSRLMKLGAPSDVWSLGCILYQMTYGRTPFSHITGMYQKISVIPDPSYEIDYPATGIGGVPVPRTLVTIIRGCLQRNKDNRPTIRRMLDDNDIFLNPDRLREGTVEISYENLRILLENAIGTAQEQGPPTPDTIASWAHDVYRKLERRMEATGRGMVH